MRVLILGGNGMLGHKLWQLRRRTGDTWVTMRDPSRHQPTALFDFSRVIGGVDAADFATAIRAFDSVQPEVVVNCIGVVKQRPEGRSAIPCIAINSLFPHRLAEAAAERGARIIHLSTDCVFSGSRGNYRETDFADADDLYGRSKFLGEVSSPRALTLRTSMIGRELHGRSGLVEWFLANRGGSVAGYRRAIFSGLTTLALARVINDLVERPPITGLYHVSSVPISKHELLQLLNEVFAAQVRIQPADEPAIDRSLNSERFRAATGWTPPRWSEMIAEMANDPTPYDEWRRTDVL